MLLPDCGDYFLSQDLLIQTFMQFDKQDNLFPNKLKIQ